MDLIGGFEHGYPCSAGWIAGLLSGQHANEAVMNQIEASDQWNYYQAKSIKASVLDAKMSLTGAPNESDQSRRDRYEKEQEEIKSQAEQKEAAAKIKLSQARSVRAWRDPVPDRDCHCGNLRADKETVVLVREFGLRCRRLRLSDPRVDGNFSGSAIQKPLGQDHRLAKKLNIRKLRQSFRRQAVESMLRCNPLESTATSEPAPTP